MDSVWNMEVSYNEYENHVDVLAEEEVVVAVVVRGCSRVAVGLDLE